MMAAAELERVFTLYERRSSNLIPLLQAVQNEYGYLPEQALREVARYTRTPESRVFGVATFYAQFHLTPQGRHRVQVCRGTACHVRGGGRILAEAKRLLGLKEGETSDDLEYTLETVACIGACALAPCMMIDDEVHGRLNTFKAAAILRHAGEPYGADRDGHGVTDHA